MTATVQDIVLALRQLHSRAWVSRETGITYAKLANLEKGRPPTDQESEAVDALAQRLELGDVAPGVPPTHPPAVTATEPRESTSDTPGEDLELIQWVDAPDPGTTMRITNLATGEWVTTRGHFDSLDPMPKVMGEFPGVEETEGHEVGKIGELFVTVSLPSPTVMSMLDGVRRYGGSEAYTFKRCRRQWKLAYYDGLRLSREEPTGPKHIGDRVHRALQRWYVADPAQRVDPRDALERLIVDDFSALTRQHPAVNDDPNCGVPAEVLKRFTDDANLERVMLDGYMQWLEETGADSEYEVIGSEEYREAMIMPDVAIIAKLDARVRRTTDGAYLNLEHKTVGSIPTLVHNLPLDEQSQWQILVERRQSDDDETRFVAGTVFNIMRRVKRTVRANPPFYQRVEMHRSLLETTNFETRVIGVVSDIENTRRRLDAGEDHRLVAYPTPTSECHWRCQFFAICGMMDDGSRVEAALENFYDTGDPYDYYTK